jgi:hypothetical protein
MKKKQKQKQKIYKGLIILFILVLIVISYTAIVSKVGKTGSVLSPLWSLLGYSSEKEILSYNFERPVLTKGIFKEYKSQKYIFIEVPININRTGLAPIIKVSPGASVSPASGFSPDYFKQPVVYTVTAEDGTTQTYKVYLTGVNPI